MTPFWLLILLFPLLASPATLRAHAQESWQSRLIRLPNRALPGESCGLNKSSAIRIIQESCEYAIANSPQCRSIKNKDRLRPCGANNDSSFITNSTDRFLGCAIGMKDSALESLKGLNDLIIWYANYLLVLDEGKTQKEFTAATQREIASVSNYVSSHYARAYETHATSSSETERQANALRSTASAVGKEAWANIESFVSHHLSQLDCLNHEEQNRILCKFVGDVTLPPTGLFAIMRHGHTALAHSPELRTALSSAKNEIRGGSRVSESAANAPVLCETCPPLRMSDASKEHIQTHIAADPDSYGSLRSRLDNLSSLSNDQQKTLIESAMPLGRNRVAQTLYPPDTSPGEIFNAIADQKNWTPDPVRVEGRLGFVARIEVGPQKRPYAVKLIVCNDEPCKDFSGRFFQKGDIISVIPHCGHGVIRLKPQTTMRAFLDGQKTWEQAAPEPLPCR